jgi:hypothetical protein
MEDTNEVLEAAIILRIRRDVSMRCERKLKSGSGDVVSRAEIFKKWLHPGNF